MIELTDLNRIMDELGGNKHVAKLTGRKQSAVSNWRKFENFPADTYLVMTGALQQLGFSAPARLWRMAQPPKASHEQCGETV